MPPKSNTPKTHRNPYSTLLEAIEANNSPAEASSLKDEIALLRLMIRRTMQLADGLDDLRQLTQVLDALGAASTRLAGLLRAQKNLTQSRSALVDEISLAIQQVNSELRSKK